MSHQRYSCDRCRQHKVRCLKIGEASQPLVDHGLGQQFATCERCAKAEVPCVYSSRQKKGRSSVSRPRRDSHAVPFSRGVSFGQDFAGLFSAAGGTNAPFPGDLAMPVLNEMDMAHFEDSDFYGWDSIDPSPSSATATLTEHIVAGEGSGVKDSEPSCNIPRNDGEDTADDLITQVAAVSIRATRATRQLYRTPGDPLMVSSPEINEAFETANSLVQIVNDIPIAKATAGPPLVLPGIESDPRLTAGCGPIFLVIACHQHVLGLFKAICASIQRSVGFRPAKEGQKDRQPALHGDGAECAQFVMVLQLIMHLVNRLGRSLRIETRTNPTDMDVDANIGNPTLLNLQKLTPQTESEDEILGSSTCFIDIAQDVLTKLPEEHLKLKQVIQQLQAHMEGRLHT